MTGDEAAGCDERPECVAARMIVAGESPCSIPAASGSGPDRVVRLPRGPGDYGSTMSAEDVGIGVG
jgi:hypothetical protein